MARNSISVATVYSSAQCILSVVGSVGVILLFAGIPQLIYSPVVSAANLLTFVMGALLIMTMVVGNTFLNYKFRRMDRGSNRQGTGQGESDNGSAVRSGDPEDKPPSYDTILSLEGSPPEYASIVPQKPPKYEEIVKETYTACGPGDDVTLPTTFGVPPQPLAEGSPAPRTPQKILTLNRVEEEVMEDEVNFNAPNDKCETVARSVRPEDEEQNIGEQANRSLSSRDRDCVASEAAKNTESQFLGESET